jgi:poly-gamma-glutamate biosynthesis protein PgsC/CapC
MIDLLPLAVGIGLVVSLLFSEVFGLAAGGMVVPGYIALHLNNPLSVLLTVTAAFATFAIVQALSSVMIVYGRRRTVLMILVGYLLGAGLRYLFAQSPLESVSGSELAMIGYIIPGLIAIWMDRQGLVETVSALATASVVVRLVMVLLVGSELLS